MTTAFADDRVTASESAVVEAEISRLSTQEIESALHATSAPRFVRSAITSLIRTPSARLGRLLAGFDAAIGTHGLGHAARSMTMRLGASIDVDGACPKTGAVLVVTNHPGAYDALALMGALGRDDIAFVASDRAFLRAMPKLCAHLVFVAEEPSARLREPSARLRASVLARARGVRQALDWLSAGHVLVQFGAGSIEPDARFAARGTDLLGGWNEGTGLLANRAARASAAIVPCFVSGVHSPRAKRLLVVRWAERHGITTIAPLVQATVPGFRDVVVSVKLGEPLASSRLREGNDRKRTELLREAVAALAGQR